MRHVCYSRFTVIAVQKSESPRPCGEVRAFWVVMRKPVMDHQPPLHDDTAMVPFRVVRLFMANWLRVPGWRATPRHYSGNPPQCHREATGRDRVRGGTGPCTRLPIAPGAICPHGDARPTDGQGIGEGHSYSFAGRVRLPRSSTLPPSSVFPLPAFLGQFTRVFGKRSASDSCVQRGAGAWGCGQGVGGPGSI